MHTIQSFGNAIYTLRFLLHNVRNDAYTAVTVYWLPCLKNALLRFSKQIYIVSISNQVEFGGWALRLECRDRNDHQPTRSSYVSDTVLFSHE